MTEIEMNNFLEQLRFLWKEYVLENENNLTEDAKELRRQLLACTAEAK